MRLVILVFLGPNESTTTFVSPYYVSLLQRGLQVEGKAFVNTIEVHSVQYFGAALLIF
jgi:hypothetical protein